MRKRHKIALLGTVLLAAPASFAQRDDVEPTLHVAAVGRRIAQTLHELDYEDAEVEKWLSDGGVVRL